MERVYGCYRNQLEDGGCFEFPFTENSINSKLGGGIDNRHILLKCGEIDLKDSRN